jgi:hypothetical protein
MEGLKCDSIFFGILFCHSRTEHTLRVVRKYLEVTEH